MSENVVHALAGRSIDLKLGASGGMISMALTYPLIKISTGAQVSRTKDSQMAVAARILKEEGFAGFYSGIESALFGIAITQAIYYYWYELVKSTFEGPGKKILTIAESIMSGALAGTATSVLTNPICDSCFN